MDSGSMYWSTSTERTLGELVRVFMYILIGLISQLPKVNLTSGAELAAACWEFSYIRPLKERSFLDRCCNFVMALFGYETNSFEP
jgi:hypothetical protein